MKFNGVTFIKREHNKWIKVDLNLVLYIEAFNNKSIIYLENGNTVLCDSSIFKVQNLLPIGFERIHQNYIVNMAFVEYINTIAKKINLKNNTTFNYGVSYKENIQPYIVTTY